MRTLALLVFGLFNAKGVSRTTFKQLLLLLYFKTLSAGPVHTLVQAVTKVTLDGF